MTRLTARPVTGPIAHHGEGPVWWPDGTLRMVDMLAGDVLTLTPHGDAPWPHRRRHVATVAAFLRPRVGGGAVIATETGLRLEDPDGALHDEHRLCDRPGIRLNDGGCAPDGTLYAGSMAYDAREDAGTLWRCGPDLVGRVEIERVSISNGIDWSADRRTAFYADTATGRVDAFDWSPDRGLTHRRPHVVIAPEDGAPDGLCTDADGAVWVALWGGSAVHRYDRRGRLTTVVDVPARHVTACALGGPQGRELVITTSREGLSDDPDPLAGSVFVAQIEIPGSPRTAFRWSRSSGAG